MQPATIKGTQIKSCKIGAVYIKKILGDLIDHKILVYFVASKVLVNK
jgi:hypothetical protein